jgi:hypothetical protein
MSDTNVETVVVKPRLPWTRRILWMVVGAALYSVVMWAVPSTQDIGVGLVNTAVERAPGVADTVTTTVGGWIEGLQSE